MIDFGVIFRLRTKKLWWVDVIFYFAVSFLIAAVSCYLIFLAKNVFQRNAIEEENTALQTVGTDRQKEHEEGVISYQQKINDFTELFKNHDFASNAFAFMQTQTMPNIWFGQFSLDKKTGGIQLTGEADSLDILGRQVASFENNKYVENLGSLNSSLGGVRVQFSTSLLLDKSIFSYVSDMTPIMEPVAPVEEPAVEEPATGEQQSSQNPNTEKSITAFHILLDPEVIGVIDQTNYVVTSDVPFGTDVQNLNTSIDLSTGATVSPETGMPQNFTSPVTYKVTAQDGTVQDYRVVVNILSETAGGEGSKKSGLAVWIGILSTIVVLVAVGVAVFFAWRRMKNKKKGLNINNSKPSI